MGHLESVRLLSSLRHLLALLASVSKNLLLSTANCSDERMGMVEVIAEEVGASLPPFAPPSLQSSMGPSCPSPRPSDSFMPENKLGELPFEDDEDLKEGWTRSRVVFKWMNGYSYDLQFLLGADMDDLMADAWDTDDYSNTPFNILSAPGTKIIKKETYREWLQIGWQEFHG